MALKIDHVWTDNQGFYFQFSREKDNTRSYERYGAGMNHIGYSAPTAEFVYAVQSKMREAGFDAPETQDFKQFWPVFSDVVMPGE